MRKLLQKSPKNPMLFARLIVVGLMLFASMRVVAQDQKNTGSPPELQTMTSIEKINPNTNVWAIPIVEPSFVNLTETDGNKIGSPEQIKNNDAAKNGFNSNSVLMLPPLNDGCAAGLGAAYTLLPTATYQQCGTLQAKTLQAGEYVGCYSSAPTQTAWYSFTADQAKMWLCIKPNGGFVCNSSFGMTVFGPNPTCLPGAGNVVGCKDYFPATGTNNRTILKLTGLVSGQIYLVQVAINASCPVTTDDFCIKLGHPNTCTTCANVCGPMCVESGPTWTTCCTVAEVNVVATTCPAYPLSPPLNAGESDTSCYSFTAPNDTVNLQQIIYASCNPNTLSFTYNLYTSTCTPIQSGNVFVNNMITNLTVGNTYKICYNVTASCSWDSTVEPFAYTGSSTLPVNFLSFGAIPQSEKVKLYWSTASEENSKEYIIERSTDRRIFSEIGHVSAAGNSTSLLNYKAYDSSPIEGNNYYRLKQVDFNGKFTYTKLVSARFSASAGDLHIVPNPASEKASIFFNTAGNYSTVLKVSDMKGKTIFTKQFISEEGVNEYSLNMNEMSKGIYTVQLIVDDKSVISKLVKQ